MSDTSETTQLETQSGCAACHVTVYTAGTFVVPPTAGRATAVHEHVAYLLPAPKARNVLAWRYGHDAWATASCPERRRYEDSALYEIAESVRFRNSEVRLPFTFDSLPLGYSVDQITEIAGKGMTVQMARAASAEDGRPSHLTSGEQEQASTPFNADGTPVTFDGYPGVINNGPPISLCVDAQGHHFCASTEDGERPTNQAERSSASSIAALRQLLVAARFLRTWTTAPPGPRHLQPFRIESAGAEDLSSRSIQ